MGSGPEILGALTLSPACHIYESTGVNQARSFRRGDSCERGKASTALATGAPGMRSGSVPLGRVPGAPVLGASALSPPVIYMSRFESTKLEVFGEETRVNEGKPPPPPPGVQDPRSDL